MLTSTHQKIKSLELPIHISSFFDYVESLKRSEEIAEEIEIYSSSDMLVREIYGVSFDIQNVASGIKTFGVLQLLLKSGLSENTIFFWEEPEAHLHPEWQVKFGEIIAKIVEKDNFFVISTHNPFIVEMLRVLAKENEIDAKFYYMDKHSEVIEVNDESWDI